ncbi:MAG: efflux RND transporter periplasmic adaptor subunit [Cryobacterium sp.]|nr:efflux RND transporter periplasmic adaptor subunit [Oligoflexia bacterium]
MEVKKKKSRWKSWIFFFVLITLFFSGAFYAWKKSRPSPVAYREDKARKGDLKVVILSTGTVQPENRLEIKAPTAGRIDSVLVKEGQRVKRGQILAWMSSTERAALLDAARSKGEEEVKRWEDMYRPTPILAPINGTLILRSIEAGQSFATTDAILVMSDRLTVKAQVDETDIAQIRLGEAAEITLDAYGKETVAAKVDQIAFEAKTVSNVTTYVVDVLPLKTPSFMRSGMTANVNFLIESKSGVLLIPTEAIRAADGKMTTLLRGADGNPKEVDIEIGSSDGKRTEVKSGVLEGETVLTQEVKPKEKNKSSSPFSPGRR